MNLSEKEKRELLAQAGDSPVAILILEEAKKMYDDLSQDAVRQGRICDDDFRRDIRYRLGMCEALRMLLNKVKDAKELVKNQ